MRKIVWENFFVNVGEKKKTGQPSQVSVNCIFIKTYGNAFSFKWKNKINF